MSDAAVEMTPADYQPAAVQTSDCAAGNVNLHTFTGVVLPVSRLRERIIAFIHGFTAVAFCKGVGVNQNVEPAPNTDSAPIRPP